MPPTHPPQISEFFVWDSEGHKSVLSSVTRLQEIYNPIIYKPGPRSQPCLCPNGHLFFQQSCYVGNPLSYKYALPYIYSQYHIMREKCYNFLGHSQPLRGGGGGGTCPPGPPLSPALIKSSLDKLLICRLDLAVLFTPFTPNRQNRNQVRWNICAGIRRSTPSYEVV